MRIVTTAYKTCDACSLSCWFCSTKFMMRPWYWLPAGPGWHHDVSSLKAEHRMSTTGSCSGPHMTEAQVLLPCVQPSVHYQECVFLGYISPIKDDGPYYDHTVAPVHLLLWSLKTTRAKAVAASSCPTMRLAFSACHFICLTEENIVCNTALWDNLVHMMMCEWIAKDYKITKQ